MNPQSKYCIFFLIGLFALGGCGYEFPTQSSDTEVLPGEASELEQFVVVGGSITSGVMDGALYSRGQMTAYPNLLGARLDSVFEDEVYGYLEINSEHGYNPNVSSQNDVKGRFALSYRNISREFPGRIASSGEAITSFEGSTDTVNNFSVPGVRSYQINSRDSLSGNVYFDRFANQDATNNLLDFALSKNPTIVLLSVGTGDVYPYLLNGAAGRSNPPLNDIQKHDATPLSLFEQSVENVVGEILNSSDADIILPTIIDPTNFFYFNTLSWFYPVNKIGSQKITESTAHYEMFNSWVREFNFSGRSQENRPSIIFGGDVYNAKVFIDDFLPYAEANDGSVIPKYRQMERREMMLYSAESKQYNSFTSDKNFATIEPAADKFVISSDELEIIKNLLESYNEVLRTIANREDRVMLLDFNKTTKAVMDGVEIFDGVRFNVGFDQNTIISADGYFPNKKGQALFANKLLELLNDKYGVDFKPFDINKFPGNETNPGF